MTFSLAARDSSRAAPLAPSARASRANVSSGAHDASAWVALASRAPSRSVDARVRTSVEQTTGRDLGAARVRTGESVDRAAEAFGAQAFTVGRDVHVRSDAPRTGTQGGDALMAHELAHVAQQSSSVSHGSLAVMPSHSGPEREADRVADTAMRGGRAPITHRSAAAVQRKPSPNVHKETNVVITDKAQYDTARDAGYWGTQLTEIYETHGSDELRRAPLAEREAIMSAVWSLHRARKSLTTEETQVITLPAGTAQKQALAYLVTFSPPATPKARPVLSVEFIAAGPSAIAAAPTTPKTTPEFHETVTQQGFADKAGIAGYETSHPEELNQLVSQILASPVGAIDRLVVTHSPGSKGHVSTFFVSGTKAKDGTFAGLTVRLVDEAEPTSPKTTSDGRDIADLMIERARAKGSKTPLGKLVGLDKVPAGEVFGVKLLVWSYLTAASVPNAEVDAVVPKADGTSRALYTFRFQATSHDVVIERVGDEGTGATTLDPAKRQLDVRSARGFDPKAATDASTLKSWIATRYPALTPSGSTAPDMIASANKQLATDAGKRTFLEKNYAVTVPDEKAAKIRLRLHHDHREAQIKGVKPFDATTARLMEWSFESLSDAEVAFLKGVFLMRQDVRINRTTEPAKKAGDPPKDVFTPAPDTGAATMRDPSDATDTTRSIVVYDHATALDRHLWSGSAATTKGGDPLVSSESVAEITHEVGHLLTWSALSKGAQAAFEKKFTDAKSKLKVDPITKYAATTTVEYFAEAFAQYHTDPEWMRVNLPDMYAWFGALAKTGTAP